MPHPERIPAQPFADFLNEYVARLRQAYDPFRMKKFAGVGQDPVLTELTRILGWSHEGLTRDDSAQRKLYRYRYCVRDGKKRVNGKTVGFSVHTDNYAYGIVEDALHCAGYTVEAVYADWSERNAGNSGSAREVLRFLDLWENVAERVGKDNSVGLLPEKYCARCDDVSPFENGKCIWCLGRREYRELIRRRKNERRWYTNSQERLAA